jgi:hypothetical protein
VDPHPSAASTPATGEAPARLPWEAPALTRLDGGETQANTGFGLDGLSQQS